jgi:hypothetical protein
MPSRWINGVIDGSVAINDRINGEFDIDIGFDANNRNDLSANRNNDYWNDRQNMFYSGSDFAASIQL